MMAFAQAADAWTLVALAGVGLAFWGWIRWASDSSRTGSDPDGSSAGKVEALFFDDPEGELTLRLVIAGGKDWAGGTGLVLYDEDDTLRAEVLAHADGSEPELSLYNGEDAPRLELTIPHGRGDGLGTSERASLEAEGGRAVSIEEVGPDLMLHDGTGAPGVELRLVQFAGGRAGPAFLVDATGADIGFALVGGGRELTPYDEAGQSRLPSALTEEDLRWGMTLTEVDSLAPRLALFFESAGLKATLFRAEGFVVCSLPG